MTAKARKRPGTSRRGASAAAAEMSTVTPPRTSRTGGARPVVRDSTSASKRAPESRGIASAAGRPIGSTPAPRSSRTGGGPTLTVGELNRATLARQLLLERTKLPALDAIERIAGLQAQLAKPPFVGLWTRVAGFRREDLGALLRDRRAVRATSLRGTLHVLSARDFIQFRAALHPMLTAQMTSILKIRAANLDLAKVVATARDFLAGAPAAFDAIRAHLLAAFPRGDDRAMGFAVRTQLPLVQVPTDDAWAFPGAAAFALAESWLGGSVGAGAAPHELIRRYLAAFGPATAADAQTWSGLANLRDTFDALRPELVTFRDARGRELFDLPSAPRPPADAPAPIRFLPDFDNLVLAHADRGRIIDDAHRGAVVTKNLQVRATVLIDGRVAGTWKIERNRAAATVIVEPFSTIPKRVRGELEPEAHALARFIEPDASSHALLIR